MIKKILYALFHINNIIKAVKKAKFYNKFKRNLLKKLNTIEDKTARNKAISNLIKTSN